MLGTPRYGFFVMPLVIRFDVDVEAQLAWRAFRTPRNIWVAVCDPLKLTVEGGTWGELNENIQEAMDAVMTDLLEDGELEQFLREHGWRPVGPIPPRLPDEGIRFDLPTKVVAVPAALHA